MSKHTPGPYHYGVREDGSIWIASGDPRKGEHWQGDFPGKVSDARLFSAAPEMLLLVKLARDAQEHDAPLFRELAAAILAKAESRS